jgi:hypothetical protein
MVPREGRLQFLRLRGRPRPVHMRGLLEKDVTAALNGPPERQSPDLGFPGNNKALQRTGFGRR